MSIPTKVYVGDKIVWPRGKVEIIETVIETKDDGTTWRVEYNDHVDPPEMFWNCFSYEGYGCKYIPNESLNVQRILERYER